MVAAFFLLVQKRLIRDLSHKQLHTLTAGEALIKAQHRQGTDACGTGKDELIGQVAPLAELFERIDHRIDVIDHDTALRSDPPGRLVLDTAGGRGARCFGHLAPDLIHLLQP